VQSAPPDLAILDACRWVILDPWRAGPNRHGFLGHPCFASDSALRGTPFSLAKNKDFPRWPMSGRDVLRSIALSIIGQAVAASRACHQDLWKIRLPQRRVAGGTPASTHVIRVPKVSIPRWLTMINPSVLEPAWEAGDDGHGKLHYTPSARCQLNSFATFYSQHNSCKRQSRTTLRFCKHRPIAYDWKFVESFLQLPWSRKFRIRQAVACRPNQLLSSRNFFPKKNSAARDRMFW